MVGLGWGWAIGEQPPGVVGGAEVVPSGGGAGRHGVSIGRAVAEDDAVGRAVARAVGRVVGRLRGVGVAAPAISQSTAASSSARPLSFIFVAASPLK